MTDWVEVVVPTTIAAADEVADELISSLPSAAAGAQIRGDELVFWTEQSEGEAMLAAVRARCAELQSAGLPVDPQEVRLAPAVSEEEWRDAWKKYFHVTRLTRQLVVVPSWEEASYEPGPDDIVLHLDPGQAFGTGAHASTQLVLETLQTLHDRGRAPRRVLDIGCGSGILSIASCKLWSSVRCRAIDIDSLAVTASEENSARNGLGDRVQASSEAIAEIEGQFDLVLANIQAHVLRALSREISDRVSDLVVLSGILTSQMDEVVAAYRARGLELESVTRSEHDPEWSSAVLYRGPA